MGALTIHALGMLALAAPFLTISVLFAYFFLRRIVWKIQKRLGRIHPGFCPGSNALGTTLLLATLFYQPKIEFAIETRQAEFVEEDNEGDPESPLKYLDEQFKRIRRGEQVTDVEVRSQRGLKVSASSPDSRNGT